MAFTGSPEVGKEIAKSRGAVGQAAHPRARRHVREHRLRGRGDRPRRPQGIVEGVFSARATPAVRVPGCSSRKRATTCWRAVRRRMAALRLGDPLDESTDIGAVNSRAPARHDHRTRRAPARRTGAGAGRRRARRRTAGSGSRPPMFTAVSAGAPHRQGRALLARAHRVVVHHPGGGSGPANSTRYGLSAGVWTRAGHAERVAGRAAAGRGGVGNRSAGSTRRFLSAGSRSPGSAGKAAGTALRPTSTSPAAWTARCLTRPGGRRGPRRRASLKLYIGGAFPPLGQRPHVPHVVHGAATAGSSRARRLAAARRDATATR